MAATPTPGTPSVATVAASYAPTTNTGVSQNAIAANFAWLKFPRIDNFGSIDPQGNYWKPDSNVLTPSGYPITNLYPGTVTSVQRTGYGQTVVTVKLDNAINSLASHVFYEHMHDASVSPGQHIASGTLVGHANHTGEGAAVGVGFYSGDVYGTGSAWQVLQNDLKPGGAGLLNPTKILDSFKNGTATAQSASQSLPQNAPCAPWDIQCMVSKLQLQGIGESIGIFVLALVLIIVGFFLLAEKQVTALGKTAAKAAML
jgi:murein DD-endopeptidase MepM/ murein hydrolase activator NlpD